mgnify:CR=1 FL=1
MSETLIQAEDTKPWWQSKTLWVNAIVLAMAAAEEHIGLLQSVLPVNVYQLIAFALPVVNAALRFITSKGVRV